MSQESTAKLIVEFKSVNLDQVKRDANDAKQYMVKSAKESAEAFIAAYKERDETEKLWLQRLKERDAALLVQQKQAGASARAEIKAQQAQQLAELRANQAERLSEIKAAARKEAEAIRAARRDTSLGQRDAHVVAYNKAMAARDTGMGPRDAHVDVWKAVQAEKVALAKAAAVAERRELAATRVAERQAASERKQEAREVERARIQAAREAARQERASAASSSKGLRMGVGLVAGQGLSVGGLATVNPAIGLAVAAAYATKRVAEDLVREATVWEKFRIALTDIEGSAIKAEKATANLYQIAKAPGVGLKQAEQTYIQLRALQVEGTKAERIIKSVANAAALSGGGATEFERVNYQIVQMLSKGKVLEEDLRIMRNSMPRLTVAMREAFGTTTAEGIRKLGINAEQFLSGIVTQFEKLPKATQTLESAQENAQTAWSRFKASLVPDQAVKSSMELWTGFLDKLTSGINAVTSEGLGNTISARLIDQAVRNNPGMTRAVAKAQGTYGFSAEQIGAMYTPNNTSFTQSGESYAAYMASQEAGKKKTIEADAKILLENQKLGIQLSKNTEYEKQRLTVIVEYAEKIKEAKTAEDAAALTKQKGLQLAILAKKQKDEETKALEKIKQQIDSQRIAVMDVSDFEKKRLEIGVKYELLMREATTTAQKQALEAAKGLELEANKRERNLALTKEMADVLKEASSAFESATGKSWSAYAMQHPGSTESEIGEASLTKGMIEGRKKASEIEYKYAPEGEKLQIEYEKNRQEILEATFKTGEERNRVMKALNDQYVRDQAQMLTESATAVTSAGQSLFGDLASSYKMGVDYRYNLEKAAINKTLSLTGLEGAARVAQQQKRDDALQSLDEKRQAQMEGTYMTMFMISKGFALAESVLKLNLAIAQAAASGPFPANLAAMAAVAASVGSVVSNIAAINYAGAYDKGGDIPAGQVGMVGENGYELVTGPAHVTSTKDTAKLLAGAGAAPVVNVMNYSGQNVQVQQGTDPGTIDIIVGEVSKRVEGNLATSIRSGRGEVQSAIKETYALTRSGY